MATPYTNEAIDYCFKLYCKFYGNAGLIEKGMQQGGWPTWKAKNLYSYQDGKSGRKVGWLEKYGFEARFEKYLAGVLTPSLDSAAELVREIDKVRKGLAEEIESGGGAKNADKERLQLHRDYCNLSISALTKVEAARDTYSGFVGFLERFIDWMVDDDPKLARKLVDKKDTILKRAHEEFGETADDAETRGRGDAGMNAATDPEPPATDARAES